MNKVYSIINDMVIEGLTKEGFAWFKPWKSGGENRPFNRAKKNFYKGFNVFMLNAVMRHNNYSTNQWLSWKQAKDLGGQVKAKEKGTQVFNWNVGYFDNKTQKFVPKKLINSINPHEVWDGKLRYKKTFSLRYFTVFNVDQCDGIEPIDTGDSANNDNQKIESAENIVKNYLESEHIILTEKDDSAYYVPSRDQINMPKIETFLDSDSYYKVLFHEMVHSTGHEKRLKREGVCGDSPVSFGSDTYAKEELVAEIGSMYLVGLLGLDPKDNIENSQAYIKGWCKNLKDKPDQCVFAMGQASKSVDYIIG